MKRAYSPIPDFSPDCKRKHRNVFGLVLLAVGGCDVVVSYSTRWLPDSLTTRWNPA